MTERLARRIYALRARLAVENLDGILIQASENRRYVSGFTAFDSQMDESSGCAIVTGGHLVLATDSRFTTQAENECEGWRVETYKEGFAKLLPGLAEELQIRRLGFEERRMSVKDHAKILEHLESARVSVDLLPCGNLVEDQRVIKDSSEIESIRFALKIAEDAFSRFLKTLQLPATEKELAWKLERLLRELGADEMSFPIIAASGPSSALPHAIPSDHVCQEGEILLFDFGARVNGYCSDITRTLFAGSHEKELGNIFKIVKEAQELAISAIRPGVSAKSVDAAARDHISAHGYGALFGHGLGHGVGLAVHEAPRISPLSDAILAPGMVFTVEPGIYVPGLGGVRLENMVLVTDSGVEVLNRLSAIM
ncbi:MAG: aminopeptidase P family protein [Deltaproteobacteria bacterium]|nr:aminopeptidase P family protein [Deltaproteobacteria bacterium]